MNNTGEETAKLLKWITLLVCGITIVLSACIVGIIYADYVLQLAKSKQVPLMRIEHADYVHVAEGEVVIAEKEEKKKKKKEGKK